MKNVLSLCLSAVLALMLAVGAHADELTITGEVTYRERVALPPHASLNMLLVDIDTPEAEPLAGAAAIISRPGQVPLQFTFHVESQAIDDDGRYGLIAEIVSHNHVWFRNDVPAPLGTASDAPLLIIVSLDTEPVEVVNEPEAGDGDLEVKTELFDTVWLIDTIDGEPVLHQTQPTLSIAADRRAGGNGGCNNWFAEARFDGAALYFGAVAATRMACGPEVMKQEAVFFKALEAVSAYELDGEQLILTDSDGTALVKLYRSE
jgi:putative lipoprotein